MTILSIPHHLSVDLCGPVACKYVPVTQDISSRLEPPNKIPNSCCWKAETSFSPTHVLPSVSFQGLMVCTKLWSSSTFFMRAKTHQGLDILFTSSQQSENHSTTELSQKFRTHYALFRSPPRSNFSSSFLASPQCPQKTDCSWHFFSLQPNMFSSHTPRANLLATSAGAAVVVHLISDRAQ